MSGEFSFFGEVDRNVRGEVTSEYPAWMSRNHIEMFEEDANRLRIEIKQGFVKEKIGEMQQELEKIEAKVDEIRASKPEMSVKRKDDLKAARKTIGELIAEAMFTRSDMEMGWCDPHEEARRMSVPCINLTNDMCVLALACGIKKDKVKDKKITRTDLEKMFKIISAAIDEDGNIERLRKDEATSRTNGVQIH
jgi:hypothetical protein